MATMLLSIRVKHHLNSSKVRDITQVGSATTSPAFYNVFAVKLDAVSILLTEHGASMPHHELCSHLHKSLLHVAGVFRRGLYGTDDIIVVFSQTLSFLQLNLSKVTQVRLVSWKKKKQWSNRNDYLCQTKYLAGGSQVAHRSCRISILGDFQHLTGKALTNLPLALL